MAETVENVIEELTEATKSGQCVWREIVGTYGTVYHGVDFLLHNLPDELSLSFFTGTHPIGRYRGGQVLVNLRDAVQDTERATQTVEPRPLADPTELLQVWNQGEK
ncbi:hypothetical protein LCGC14_2660740 [marine sediment metagenome]|uniref:Uncharacterized protein n=1 Tax=marine sediment metagenome TaxID=412755 RepID=A0A0F8ZS44_9ZZZZ